ncbi:hypothetical protein [Paenibacillus pinihumi]|uniref:hypothetical protein n=1 Tax=Paenibacillus pinihumi TaxID=669462 RepID=UPI0004241FF8|nr:hypothetical protein [Paenibacillus pinihumi]
MLLKGISRKRFFENHDFPLSCLAIGPYKELLRADFARQLLLMHTPHPNSYSFSSKGNTSTRFHFIV